MGQATRPTGDRDLDRQISFVLSHPGLSGWLKSALLGALERDPVEAANEAEILGKLLRRRAGMKIAESFRRAAVADGSGAHGRCRRAP